MRSFVYILKCSDASFYTGWTSDLRKRLLAHQKGRASKYTRSRLPITLVYFEERSSKQDAMRREYEIKSFTRKKKEDLILLNPSYAKETEFLY